MKRPLLIASLVFLTVACATLKGSEPVHFAEDEKLGDVYAMAITEGYEYMFDRSGDFRIYGADIGMFEAGFGGLFRYSRLKKALKKYYGVSEHPNSTYYDLDVYENWVGMNLFVPNAKLDFHSYNPDVINWAADNMIPHPTSMIGDRTAQEVYDNVMQRFFPVNDRELSLLACERFGYTDS